MTNPAFLPKAEGSLKALLSFMKQNPNVIILVEGHVNWVLIMNCILPLKTRNALYLHC